MIIYFPHKLGQLRNGVQNTPMYLKRVIENHGIRKNLNSINVQCNNTKNSMENLSNNLHELYKCNAMFHGRKINIGGDHSMAIATVASSLNKYPGGKLKVLWFDAHPDINTYHSSISKNFHGMPLGYLTGLCASRSFSFLQNQLHFDNILYIGIRDVDDFEQDIIRKHGIKYISCEQLNTKPYQYLNTIKEFIGSDPVHLSFDVDCMDPSIIPCTGTTFKEGLNLNIKMILDNLSTDNIVNMDLTEINFDLGNEKEKKKTVTNVLHLFDKYLFEK